MVIVCGWRLYLFQSQTGNEFSVVSGLSYNFKNPSLDYQNGIEWHLDWGASHFVSKQVHIGLVGYAYQQITGDSGLGATLGDFKSRVLGIGPQIGFLFPVGDKQGYLNLKGYKEFDAEHRADGYNVWLTLVSSAPPKPEATSTRLPRKWTGQKSASKRADRSYLLPRLLMALRDKVEISCRMVLLEQERTSGGSEARMARSLMTQSGHRPAFHIAVAKWPFQGPV